MFSSWFALSWGGLVSILGENGRIHPVLLLTTGGQVLKFGHQSNVCTRVRLAAGNGALLLEHESMAVAGIDIVTVDNPAKNRHGSFAPTLAGGLLILFVV